MKNKQMNILHYLIKHSTGKVKNKWRGEELMTEDAHVHLCEGGLVAAYVCVWIVCMHRVHVCVYMYAWIVKWHCKAISFYKAQIFFVSIFRLFTTGHATVISQTVLVSWQILPQGERPNIWMGYNMTKNSKPILMPPQVQKSRVLQHSL